MRPSAVERSGPERPGCPTAEVLLTGRNRRLWWAPVSARSLCHPHPCVSTRPLGAGGQTLGCAVGCVLRERLIPRAPLLTPLPRCQCVQRGRWFLQTPSLANAGLRIDLWALNFLNILKREVHSPSQPVAENRRSSGRARTCLESDAGSGPGHASPSLLGFYGGVR